MKCRVAIKRIDQKTKKLWMSGPKDVVCSAHSKTADFTETLLGERKRLKKGAVPSVFSFRDVVPSRSGRKYVKLGHSDECAITDAQQEVTVEDSDGASEEAQEREETTTPVRIQCFLLDSRFSIDNLINDKRKEQYYTSFAEYEHFMMSFNCLCPAVNALSYQCSVLQTMDQLFLTLIKLRQAKDDIELSFFFSVSESTVSQIVLTWINFLYFQLKEIRIWPTQNIIDEYMPEDLKTFPRTRVTLDATEVPIKKPSHVEAQSITWSTYKHRNTLKTMIGCTPRCTVSLISDSFGGSASDRQIIEKSSLLKPENEMFKRKDSIMADRGIMVQDLFAAQDVHVNTPTIMRGKSQLEPKDLVKDRRVASKRIHVEGVIGLGKTFKILKEELPSSKLALGSRSVYNCYSIVNFRKSIVGSNS